MTLALLSASVENISQFGDEIGVIAGIGEFQPGTVARFIAVIIPTYYEQPFAAVELSRRCSTAGVPVGRRWGCRGKEVAQCCTLVNEEGNFSVSNDGDAAFGYTTNARGTFSSGAIDCRAVSIRPRVG